MKVVLLLIELACVGLFHSQLYFHKISCKNSIVCTLNATRFIQRKQLLICSEFFFPPRLSKTHHTINLCMCSHRTFGGQHICLVTYIIKGECRNDRRCLGSLYVVRTGSGNAALWGTNRNSCFHKLSRPSKCVNFNVGYLVT